MIRGIKKVRGRSVAELTERGRQSVSSFAERLGVSRDLKPLDDASLFALFQGPTIESTEDLLIYFHSRALILYPSLSTRDATIAALRKNFPEAGMRILEEAHKVCDGRFDLLGYRDLDFGGTNPDWFFEPLSEKRSPRVHWSQIDELDTGLSGDKKVVWELNRHQYFTILGRAYWLTGDERFAAVFVSHVQDWIANNAPKIGLNWRSSLEISFRSLSWIWAFHFFRHSPLFSSELFAEMLKVLYLNGRHIERHLSTYSSPNTHLTGEALGLYALGNLFEGTEPGDRWLARGREVLLNALKFQFRDDGGYVEQATQYHRYSADFYLTFLIWERAGGREVNCDTFEVVSKLLTFLAHLTQPDGRTSLIGDDDGGRLHFLDSREFPDFRSTLALGALLLEDQALKFVAGEAGEELLWLAGPDGLERYNRMEGVEPAEKDIALPQSGFFVGRDGWRGDSSFILIKCGEHGFLNGAHAHADALSFVLSVKGTPVFVDSGTYTYTADREARDHYRSTAAHNCVVVNGRSSSMPDGPFSWKTKATSKLVEWKADDVAILFRGTHDGYSDLGVGYEREILVNAWASMAVTDKFETFSNNQFNITFILSPAVEPELIDRTCVVLRLKGTTEPLLTIGTTVSVTGPDDTGAWSIEPAKISPRYGLEIGTTRLTFAISNDRPFEVKNKFEFA